MTSNDRPLRVALLAYRGNPHSGGQGVYVRHLSKALCDLGHDVEVLAGPPYPDLDPRVRVSRLPSLDLYRADGPFRTPRRDEFRDWIDVAEFGLMCSAAFPEPLTFSLRAARELKPRVASFDIVHDNQGLGYGLLGLNRRRPVVATVHHPCSIDARMEIHHARGPKQRLSLWRWYSFTRMQGRVVRRLPRVICVSEAARDDAIAEFGLRRGRVAVVHNGVDADLFRPLPHVRRRPGRIIATASADVPLKGLAFLIEALAKLRTEREADLVVVGKAADGGPVRRTIARFGLEEAVRFESAIDDARLVELHAEAEVAVVPSLYEGFSLPAIEAMSCGVPLVATTGGALPEVVGADGATGLLVPPGDAGALAAAIAKLLDERDLRERLGNAGRRRVLRHFTWASAAAATLDQYRAALAASGC